MPVKIAANTPVRTEDVFFQSKKHPESHFSPESIREKIQENKEHGRSMLLYGGPYTGKTAIILDNFDDHEYIKIDCVPSMTLERVYTQILKSAGYLVMKTTTRTTTNSGKGGANLSLSVLGVNMGVNTENSAEDGFAITYEPLDMYLSHPTNITDALKNISFDQYIVLGMFDKLPRDVQKGIISDLRIFLENGVKLFIVYTGYSRKLFDKYTAPEHQLLVPICQDKWKRPELEKYISECAESLNIRFDPQFVQDLLKESNGYFRIVRDVCYKTCIRNKVFRKETALRTIGVRSDVKELVKAVPREDPETFSMYPDIMRASIETDFSEMEQFLEDFSAGLRKSSNPQKPGYELYKWILYCVITATPGELKDGISQTTIVNKIKAWHPSRKDLKSSLIVGSLTRVQKLQEEKCRHTYLAFLDDNRGGHILSIQDSDFRMWLFYRRREELLHKLDLPTNLIAPE